MNFEQLNNCVLEWAHERHIFERGTRVGQMRKTLEEVAELEHAIAVSVNDLKTVADSKGHEVPVNEAIKDGIGDTVVTLIIQAHMNDMTLVECLEHAYREISGRTGKMIDGVFVKDEGK